MDESKVTRYATEKYVNDSSPINTVSSKVLATVPASNIELQKTITVNNISINKDRRYYIEFLGSKKLCSLLVGDGTDDNITCGIGKYIIKVSNKSTNISLSINKINEDDTTATTFTDLVIYEEEVKYLDSKYLETDLVLQNSISLGRVGNIGKGSSAIGFSVEASSESSHAEGYSTTASGYYSHAENFGTTASGNGSHAEGVNTTSSGDGSHAEGFGATSSGKRSHAEGYKTISSGVNSHVEGWCTKASGNNSHAEGASTTASGLTSHAEGDSTIASSESQHVQGKYNIEDTAKKYAHIVGNGHYDEGTKNEVRSNAHTLDWEGNAWYSGKLTVGKDPTDDMDVVTKKYFDANKGSGGTTIDTSNFVEKEAGKGLSTNDLTNALKSNYDTAYTHSQAAHAPSTAQKNSDITKAEIEAKLTGDVTSHTHSQYLTAHQSLDEYATKNKPVFTGSISLGRKEGTAVGTNSFAVGFDTTASGNFGAHAEGANTTASGESSHAEGKYTIASGYQSHAEGWSTTASGVRSHAEGLYTIASSEYQHVQGKYNIEDTANKYAHIVGNGTDTNNINRSNAHTLDWEGNAWYAGKLSQEGTPTENKDLVTKKYVDDKFENINLGPYSIQYNNENNRLEFIYTPPATE